jgi:hypothetical protein
MGMAAPSHFIHCFLLSAYIVLMRRAPHNIFGCSPAQLLSAYNFEKIVAGSKLLNRSDILVHDLLLPGNYLCALNNSCWRDTVPVLLLHM